MRRRSAPPNTAPCGLSAQIWISPPPPTAASISPAAKANTESTAISIITLILHTAPRILKAWHFCRDGQITSLRPRPRLRLGSGDAVYHSALAGAGIARLAAWVGEAQVKVGRLVRVCPQYHLTSSSGQDPQMHAVYPASELPARVRDLLAALRRAGMAP